MVIAERFHFHHRNQHSGESIAEYVTELRKLALHCEFKDYLDQALRDRLVCGLLSESTQKKLAIGVVAVTTSQLSIHIDSECHFCGKKGHIAPVCLSRPTKTRPPPSRKFPVQRYKQPPRSAKWVEEGNPDSEESQEELSILTGNTHPLHADVWLNGTLVGMEIDTGAAVSLNSMTKCRTLFPDLPMKKSTMMLRTYTGENMDVRGEIEFDVWYGDQRKSLPLVIVAGNGLTLLGRNWLHHIRLDWKELNAATVHHSSADTLESIRKRYESTVFGEGLGHITPFKAKLQMKPDSQPKFQKPRPVSFAIQDAVGEELDRLEAERITERVNHSEWAAPVVAVPKKDGKFRICGDYKVTVNPALQVDQYPLPKPEDLFATLAGGEKFTTLDLSQAYLQLELEEESSQCTTINTHKGLYRFKRLPFGIASAPVLFQKTMDTILQDIPRAMCYINDIMITGTNDAEHLATLERY